MNNPSSPRHGPRPSNGGSDAAAAAALRGASLAFSKSSQPKPVPPPKNLGANNALSAAATSASRDRSRSRSPAPPQSRQTTGGSYRIPPSDQHFGADGTFEGGSLRDRLARLGTSQAAAASSHLQPSSAGARPTSYDPKNPSFIAATLAASRSASPSPQNKTPSPAHHGSVPNMRAALAAARGRPRRESVESSSLSSVDLPDTSSIAPTNSLISMFEGPREGDEDGDMDPIKKSPAPPSHKMPTARNKVMPPPLRPMTPERRLSPKDEVTPTRPPTSPRTARPPSPLKGDITPKAKPKPKPKAKPQDPTLPPATSGTTKPVEPPVPRKPSAQVSPPRARQQTGDSNVSYLKPQRSGRQSQAHSISPTPKPTRPKPSNVDTMSVGAGAAAHQQALAPAMGSPSSRARVPPSTPAPKPRNLQVQPDEQHEPRIIRSPVRQVVSPQPTRRAQPKLKPPTPPQARNTSLPSNATRRKPQPSTPPQLARPAVDQRNASADNRPTTSGTTSSNDTFVSASSIQTPVPRSPSPKIPPPRREPVQRPSSTVSLPVGSPTRSVAPPLPRRNPAVQSSSNLPLHSLSNAIMAGSLAASRLTPSNTGTSTKSLGPPPPLPRRGKSPRLRQTLRQPFTASDDEESEARRIKKHHGHHSNKKHFHHEGARKRWREEIKPTERKRYEALWASNRGVLHEYLPPMASASTDTVHLTAGKDASSTARPNPGKLARPDLSDYVLNIVVREIWRRSRLPDDELAEVWELVTGHQGSSRKGSGSASPVVPNGMLGKQQFVVGTWIIDQRLRGRKIPTRISPSVWDSAKGVRVSSPKAGKDSGKVRK